MKVGLVGIHYPRPEHRDEIDLFGYHDPLEFRESGDRGNANGRKPMGYFGVEKRSRRALACVV
jgi:hypothetical protein